MPRGTYQEPAFSSSPNLTTLTRRFTPLCATSLAFHKATLSLGFLAFPLLVKCRKSLLRHLVAKLLRHTLFLKMCPKADLRRCIRPCSSCHLLASKVLGSQVVSLGSANFAVLPPAQVFFLKWKDLGWTSTTTCRCPKLHQRHQGTRPPLLFRALEAGALWQPNRQCHRVHPGGRLAPPSPRPHSLPRLLPRPRQRCRTPVSPAAS
mmetsp:Transcript_34599/g.73696  ORF Transcript_34599/g.73696 Transcript_34599/m.73696 type:complete len:206 (-) Transcript_34599:349-966(-)